MNYKIIQDEVKLKQFIDWLPELNKHEQYYLCLFARSKYTKDLDKSLPHIKSDKAQLKRFTSTKERMFNKIQQLEIALGTYMQRDVPVPQEALALYITINPRDLRKATYSSLIQLARVLQGQQGDFTCNPHQEVMSEIQKSRSRTEYVIFDFDSDNLVKIPHLANCLYGCINSDAVSVINTRGGLHLLVKPEKVEEKYRKTWYNHIKAINGLDQVGDIMSPVPGTYQGGFVPYFL